MVNDKIMKKLLTLLAAITLASSALADPRFQSGYQYGNDSEYIFGPRGTYLVSPQDTFTGGYRYSLPRVIITDPCGDQHHGTRYSYGWVFD